MRLAKIGMWNIQERERLTACCTENEQDIHGPVRIKKFSEKSTLCFHSTLMLDNRTMLPIALQCLYAEQIYMDRAMRLIERVPNIVPLAARVDGVYFAARSAEATTELKSLAFDHTYGISQRSVYQIKAARTDHLPRNAQHHEYHEVVCPRLVGKWRHYHENDTIRMDNIAEHSGV